MAEPDHHPLFAPLLSPAAFQALLAGPPQAAAPQALPQAVAARVAKAQAWLANHLATTKGPVYGVNTGFGHLANVPIAADQLSQLQLNLLRSHACGTGPALPPPVVQAMLLLKARSLGMGHSGVRPVVIERLLAMARAGATPVVPAYGSLGASGDLAPLAHLCLPLVGEGLVQPSPDAAPQPAEQWLQAHGLEPLALGPKEGLALLNGTQAMLALGLHAWHRAHRLTHLADALGALSLEAFHGRHEPFDARLQAIRPQPGQALAAARVRNLRQGSPWQDHANPNVQDPYAFRCIPQVHGTVHDGLAQVEATLAHELNAATDNPNVFADDGAILAGGNFHGQALALATDQLALLLAYLGGISERRCYQLLHGQRGLPAFLVAEPGVNSGYMILQYTAAALANELQRLAHPSSAHSLPSSNGQEDFVSMGQNAALKAVDAVAKAEEVLAIEWLHAAQAVTLRWGNQAEATLPPALRPFYLTLRQQVPPLNEDRILATDLQAAAQLVRTTPLVPLPDNMA